MGWDLILKNEPLPKRKTFDHPIVGECAFASALMEFHD
jgi:hypothetical protein